MANLSTCAPRLATEKTVFRSVLARIQFAGDSPESAMITYAEHLKDPRWQRKRLERLQLAEFRCENCDDETKTLHVHHKFYRKGAMPWEYTDQELEVLCEDCHESIHQLRSRLNAAVTQLDVYDVHRLLGYAQALHMWGLGDNPGRLKLENYEHAEGASDVIGFPMGAEQILELMAEDRCITARTLRELWDLRKNRKP